MIHKDALILAEKLVDRLIAGCTRIEIAGSVRRNKPQVGDIEIVATPDLRPPRPVFGQTRTFATNLDAILYSLCMGDDEEIVLHGEKNGPRYKQFWVGRSGTQEYSIKLDLFLCVPPSQWGVLYLIRTGPWEFSQWMVTPRSKGGALPDGYKCEGNCIKSTDGSSFLMPDEVDYFKFCGLEWLPPENRRPLWKSFRWQPQAESSAADRV